MFGRHAEVEAVVDMMSRFRLVTVIGPGGVGKTRLALAAAPDDAAVVALAGTAGPDLLATIARVVAPGATVDRSPLEAIADASPRFLVLDTFEQLLSSAPRLDDLLAACPDLSILVTSRARLGLEGERVITLRPLSSDAAAAMFADRAEAVGGRTGDEASVKALCDLLDRLPLAIELAAARSPLFSPDALADRLRRPGPGGALELLARGPAGMADRHRSIRATIEWSHALLDPPARVLFRRLGVFPASFSLDAVEHVCPDPQELPAAAVLDALASLVDLHLVEPAESHLELARFRLLDTLHEYAAEELRSAGETALLRGRLVDWGVAFGRRAGRGLAGPAEARWLPAVESELPALGMALDALAATGDGARGLTLAADLAPYWVNRGPIATGRKWLQTFLALSEAGSEDLPTAVAGAWLARLEFEQGELGRLPAAIHARAVIGAHPAEMGEWLRATDHLAYGLTLAGDLTAADALTEEAFGRAEAAGETYWMSILLVRQALSAQRHGHHDVALAYAEQAVARASAIGFGRVVARARQVVATEQTDRAAAYDALLANLAANEATGDGRGVISALGGLGAVSAPHPEAAQWFARGLEEAIRIGYWHGQAFCVMGIAARAAWAGRVSEAVALDRAIRPHWGVLQAQLPPSYFKQYEATFPQEDAGVHEPAHPTPAWHQICEQARILAADIAAGAVAVKLPAARRRGPRDNPDLTRRELEVLAAIARGHTNPRIAAELFLSVKTVMHHSMSIYRKFGVRGRAEAVAHAYRHGLLVAPDR